MTVDFFRPGRSFLHRYDPRAKLLLLIPVSICFFLPVPPVVLAPFAASLVLVVAAALGPREVLPPLQAMAPVLVFICLLTPPFHRGGANVLALSGIVLLTSNGVRETLVLLLRFFGVTFGFFAVVRTVSLDDLVLSLRWFGLPYPFCLVVIVALRTMPTLASTWHNVQDAHRLRAGPPASQGRKKIVDTYLPVLTSLLIEAVKGIPLLAMALESRGFGRRNPRTVYAELKKGRRLAVDMAVCLCLGVLFISPGLVRW
ncbi:MAG: energy-coupling factor transporter transmembrane component T family protein [Spirochaetia bacterium]